MNYVYDIPVFVASSQNAIKDYIYEHPLCTALDIIRDLNYTNNAVRTALCRLRAGGFIKRIKIKGVRNVCWQQGQEDDYEPPSVKDGPKQRMVSEWTPCTQRDPLIDALFGRKV